MENNKFKALVDRVSYNSKPTKPEIGIIKTRLQIETIPVECTVEDFCKAYEEGKTVSPGITRGGCSATNWVEQQLFMVDIDNSEPNVPYIDEIDIINTCKEAEIKPCFIAETFNSTHLHKKYRVGFLCNEVITDNTKREFIMLFLISLFPQADVSCKNADRIFFGTDKKIHYIDTDATFSYDSMLNHIEKDTIAKSYVIEKDLSEIIPKDNINGIDLITEIDRFDFLEYLKNTCSGISHESNSYVMFKKCPICGGHDDLVYYHNSGLFTCFGKYGQQSGNIINFLMLTQNMDKKEAVEYFLYDMLGYTRSDKRQNPISISSLSNNITDEVRLLYEKFLSMDRPITDYSQDDKGISEVFATVIKDFLRYNVTRKSWMKYDGRVWTDDVGNSSVNQWAKYFNDALLFYSLSNNIFSNIKEESNKQREIEQYRKFVTKLGSKQKRDIIIKDAQSVYSIENKDLDKDTNLLNLQNGTLNLSTLDFKEHSPNDLLTKITNVSYNPEASQETFKKFVSQVMSHNQEKIDFLQRVFGYALTADTTEECMFILYGPTTRNGKSTLVETNMHMLGDYALQATPETISVKTVKDSRTASGDIARLKDVRFVNVSELPFNLVLNVALVKTLTGGDTLTARHLYERETQFKPQFKLFINTNYLPQVDDNTLFTSGRVNIITFDKHFTVSEQDKTLKQRLRQADVLSGMLNWCLDGLKAYREQGLNIPTCVLNANANYQDKSDITQHFINECFYQSDGYTKGGDAYKEYCDWCHISGYFAEKKGVFYERLNKKGLLGVKDGFRNVILGYSLYQNSIF